MPTSVAAKQKLFPSRIDLPEDIRHHGVELLNQALASTLDLTTQIKQAHWNVKGKDFYQLHELFDLLAEEVEKYVDKVAERATTLGGVAMGTARLAAQNSILKEYPHQIANGMDHVKALAEAFSTYGKLVRENIEKFQELEDADTADLFTEISRTIDMRLWFLEAHLQG